MFGDLKIVFVEGPPGAWAVRPNTAVGRKNKGANRLSTCLLRMVIDHYHKFEAPSLSEPASSGDRLYGKSSSRKNRSFRWMTFRANHSAAAARCLGGDRNQSNVSAPGPNRSHPSGCVTSIFDLVADELFFPGRGEMFDARVTFPGTVGWVTFSSGPVAEI